MVVKAVETFEIRTRKKKEDERNISSKTLWPFLRTAIRKEINYCSKSESPAGHVNFN